MNKSRKEKELVDATGQPLREKEEFDVPPDIQHYIDSKVRFAADDIKKEQNRKWRLFAVVVALISGTLGWSLYSIWKSVPVIVSEQFVKPQIKTNVDRILEEKTKAYIAGRLDPVEKQLKRASDEIGRQTEDVNAKLKQVENLISKFSAAEGDLVAKTEFATLVIDAQSDDRKAYDKLRAIGDDKENPFNLRAQQSAAEVMNKHSMPYELGGERVPWVDGFDPSQLSLNEIIDGFDTFPGWVKHALIRYVAGRADIPRTERLRFMVQVMETDGSLQAVEAAGRYFAQETGQQIKALATDYFLEWWAKNCNGILRGASPSPTGAVNPVVGSRSPAKDASPAPTLASP